MDASLKPVLVAAVGTLALCTAAAAQAPSSPDARAGIEAVNRTFEGAAKKGDAAAVAALYTADAMLLPPNSEPVKGTQAIADAWKGALGSGLGLKLTTIDLTVHGEAAHEVGTYEITTLEGSPLDRGKYVVIWRQVDGAWKLQVDIWNTSLPAPQP